MKNKITQKDIENAIYLSEQYQKSIEENPQPLFTLTEEEVEIVKHALKYTQGSSKFYNPILNEAIIDGNPFYPILKRINEWQDAMAH